MKNRSILALTLCVALGGQALLAGLGSKKASYVGGTWTTLAAEAEGTLDVSDSSKALFRVDKGGVFEIPFDRITSLEYGQKAGRRVGSTIALGVTTLGIGALPMLFSKKRKHYLSVGYKDADGKDAGVVLELGKDITRPTLKVFEVRSGKKIEYESDEAKKHVGN
jgi:hypothetical protein